jgi:hypothetical protein
MVDHLGHGRVSNVTVVQVSAVLFQSAIKPIFTQHISYSLKLAKVLEFISCLSPPTT